MDFWPGRPMTAFFCADLQAKGTPSLTSELRGFQNERNMSVRVMHVHAFQGLRDWSCSHLNQEEKEKPTKGQMGKWDLRIPLPDQSHSNWYGKQQHRAKKENTDDPCRISTTETCGSQLRSGSLMTTGTYTLHCPQPDTRSLGSWRVCNGWHLCEKTGITFSSSYFSA